MSSVAELYLQWLTMQLIKFGVNNPVPKDEIKNCDVSGWGFIGNAAVYMHVKFVADDHVKFTDNAVRFLEARHGGS